jgi:hypothetical protein
VHTVAFQAQLWERRLWLRDAGCRSVRFQGVLRLRAAAEIWTGDRRVSEVRSVALDREQRQGAFPAERRDDFGKGLTGPGALEISDLSAARPRDEAHRAHPWGLPPLGAAPEALQVSVLWMWAQLRVWLSSDVSGALSPEAVQTAQQQDVPERHSEKRLRELLLVRRERATAQPGPQVLCAASRALDRPVLQALQLEPQRVARFSLSQPQLWLLPRQLPPLPDRGSVSAPARRARYQSSSSASSSP